MTSPYKWDYRFLDLANLVATWSKDQSTKVGSIIVGEHRNILSTGYNGLPRGIKDPPDPTVEGFNIYAHGYTHVGQAEKVWDERVIGRPSKYLWAEHAERNAIYNCARHGITTDGTTLYVTPMPPCADCARAIIQSGIIRVVTIEVRDKEVRDRWQENWDVAHTMFFEANVELRSL